MMVAPEVAALPLTMTDWLPRVISLPTTACAGIGRGAGAGLGPAARFTCTYTCATLRASKSASDLNAFLYLGVIGDSPCKRAPGFSLTEENSLKCKTQEKLVRSLQSLLAAGQ